LKYKIYNIKFISPFIWLLACFFVLNDVAGQTTITLGTLGTTSTNDAFVGIRTTWRSAKTQYLIRASEITAAGGSAGSLSQISLNISSASNTLSSFAIGIASTAQTDFTAGDMDAVTTVYSSTSESAFSSTGWRTINFSTLFSWDGTSNIIIQICWGRQDPNTSQGELNITSPGYTCTKYQRSDGGTGSGGGVGCGFTTVSARSTSRPVIRLTILPPCFNPTSAGSIGNAQSSNCGSFDPTTITSVSLPSGQNGTLEYKWQQSTTSSSSGFADIGSSNSTTYDPGVISQTTWYKRLARVNCQSNWSGAAESNVIEMTVSCINVNNGGTIGNAQSNCAAFDPTTISSLTLPSGTSCPYEYKWQQSTSNSGTGYSDILGATSATYDPGLLSQTTWFRRLAKANCTSSWASALSSNIIAMAIGIQIEGNPVSDTVYNQSGNASFGVLPVPLTGASYQWEVSTNGGSSWSNISNSALYSGTTTSTLQITNPTNTFNGYQYRCVVTNSCGSVTSGGAILFVLQQNIFSNTTSVACGGWGSASTTSECLTRTIAVSGLSLLNTSTNQLIQINVNIGSSSCLRDLSTYDFSLTSPTGTVYNFISNLGGASTTSTYANIKFRDHPALERVNQYSSPGAWFPYSIGYYAVETDNSFASTFNNQNPNGNWTFSMCEQDDGSGSGISFSSVELIFGPTIKTNDLTTSSANNECTGVACIGSDGFVTIGTNNGYASEDASTWPGTTTAGCSWNGANNNSAWFSFIASATTAYLTLSGIHSGINQIETQPIIFSRSGGCSSGTYSVPSGGCPEFNANFSPYLEAQADPYVNGISGNVQFNLSGLTIGQTYYLYIDGNGGAASTFYIEAPFGCQTCTTPLPVKFSNLSANCSSKGTSLSWSTESELNNDYFVIEKSTNGETFDAIGTIKGAGNSSSTLNYKYNDLGISSLGVTYYRIKQVDFDGTSAYSDLVYINCKEQLKPGFYPNPFSNSIQLKNINESNLTVNIFSSDSRLVKTLYNIDGNALISLDNLKTGLYFFQVVGSSNEILYNFHALKNSVDY
jgi:hypothetical protein